jgi:hypothetical protein
MPHHRLTRTAGLALMLAALAAQPATAMPIDGPVDAASPAVTQDLRSADASYAAQTSNPAATTSAPAQDLRSADGRDGRQPVTAPRMPVVNVQQPSPSSDGGLDWGNAGIGAASLLAIALLALASTAAVTRHRTALTDAGRAWRRGVGL